VSAEGTEEIDIRLRQDVDTEGAKAAGGLKAMAAGFTAASDAGDKLAAMKMPGIVKEGARLKMIAKDADAVAASLLKMAAAQDAARSQREGSAMAAGLDSLKAASKEADAARSRDEASALASANRKAKIDEAAYQQAMAREKRRDKAIASLADAREKKAMARADKLPASLQPRAVEPQLSGLHKVLAVTRSMFGDKAAGGLAAGAQKLAEVGERLGPAGPMLLKAGGVLGGAAAGLAVAAAALVVAGAVIAVKLGVAFAGQAIESVSFKKNTLAGLEAMLKSKDAAAATYADLKKFADLEAPFETKDVAANFKKLLGAGFSQAETKDILRGSFDLAALNDGNAEVANAVVGSLAKIQGQGKLTAETMEQIISASGGAVSRKGLLDQLAKSTGKSVDVLEKELSAGKIKADAGVKAILETIRTGVSGGTLGKLSKGLTGESVAGLTSTIKSQFAGLFEDIDISPLTDTLKNASGVLGGPAGEKLKTSFTGLGTQLFKTLFGPFQGPDGAAKLERFVTRVSELAVSATAVLKDLAPYVVSFVDIVMAVMGADVKTDNPVANLISAIGDAARAAMTPLDTMWKLIAKIANAEAKMLGSVGIGSGAPIIDPNGGFMPANDNAGVVANANTTGGDIMAGMAVGVTAGGPDVAAAVTAAANDAVTAAKVALGVASPSKVFAGVGKWGALGLAKGMNDNSGVVADAGAAMAGASVGGAVGGMASSAGSGGGGGGNSYTFSPSISLPPGSSSETQAAAEAGVRAAYPEWLEMMRRFERDKAERSAA
jgi:tape measure domain-containing protein